MGWTGGIEELVVLLLVVPSHRALLRESFLELGEPLAGHERVAAALVTVHAHVDGAVRAKSELNISREVRLVWMVS